MYRMYLSPTTKNAPKKPDRLICVSTFRRRKRLIISSGNKLSPKKNSTICAMKQKSASFYISGVYQKDVLEAFKIEITDALETGKNQRETIKNFKDILSGAGHRELGDYHLESIFRTNMQMAYGRRSPTGNGRRGGRFTVLDL